MRRAGGSGAAATTTAAVRAATAGYDPAPALAALHIPAIWIYGQLDRQVPVRVCVANLAAYHNPDWTVIVLPEGSHGLIATSHGLDTELAGATTFVPASIRGGAARAEGYGVTATPSWRGNCPTRKSASALISWWIRRTGWTRCVSESATSWPRSLKCRSGEPDSPSQRSF